MFEKTFRTSGAMIELVRCVALGHLVDCKHLNKAFVQDSCLARCISHVHLRCFHQLKIWFHKDNKFVNFASVNLLFYED